MAEPVQRLDVRNRLLLLLSNGDFDALAPHLEAVRLPQGLVLAEPEQASPYSYFPDSGLGSVVARSPGGRRAEVGLFGLDGMTSPRLVMGAGAGPHGVIMQVAGEGWRVESDKLTAFLETSVPFRNLLLLYAQTVATQAAFTALSNATNSIEVRLARWILMCHDRTLGDEIVLTHVVLAIMLATHRPSVTKAIHALESRRLIRAERNLIIVRNRPGLVRFAGDAYGPTELEYSRLVLGPLPSRTGLELYRM